MTPPSAFLLRYCCCCGHMYQILFQQQLGSLREGLSSCLCCAMSLLSIRGEVRKAQHLRRATSYALWNYGGVMCKTVCPIIVAS
jgi:hypothetical protein